MADYWNGLFGQHPYFDGLCLAFCGIGQLEVTLREDPAPLEPIVWDEIPADLPKHQHVVPWKLVKMSTYFFEKYTQMAYRALTNAKIQIELRRHCVFFEVIGEPCNWLSVEEQRDYDASLAKKREALFDSLTLRGAVTSTARVAAGLL